MRAVTIPLTLALLLAAALVAGCSSEPAADTGETARAASGADFPVTELDAAGMKQLLAENRGKAVFLCFWSVNCPACEQEIPELEKLADMYSGDDLKVMLVNLDPSAEAVRAYFQTAPVTEQYHGSTDLAEAYGVYAIPHLVMYNSKGDVIFNKSGYFPAAMLEAVVEYGIEGTMPGGQQE